MRVHVLGSLVCLGVLLGVVPTAPVAADDKDDCGCNAVLMPSIEHFSSSKIVELSYLKVMNKETFEEIKRNIKGGLKVVIKMIPIGGDMTWEDFHQRREELFLGEQFRLSEAEATTVLKSSLPKEAILAWLACKQDCGERSGFRCRLLHADEDTIIVKTKWVPPPAGEKARTKWEVTGGEPVAKLPEEIAVLGEVITTFKREKGKAFTLTVSGSNHAGRPIIVPKYQKPAPPKVVQSPEIFLVSALRSGQKGDVTTNKAGLFSGRLWDKPVGPDGKEVDMTGLKVGAVWWESGNRAQTNDCFTSITASADGDAIHLDVVANKEPVTEKSACPGGITKIKIVCLVVPKE